MHNNNKCIINIPKLIAFRYAYQEYNSIPKLFTFLSSVENIEARRYILETGQKHKQRWDIIMFLAWSEVTKWLLSLLGLIYTVALRRIEFNFDQLNAS